MIPSHPVEPTLENFLLQLTPGKLTVTTSDLETSIVAEQPVLEGNKAAGKRRLGKQK